METQVGTITMPKKRQTSVVFKHFKGSSLFIYSFSAQMRLYYHIISALIYRLITTEAGRC